MLSFSSRLVTLCLAVLAAAGILSGCSPKSDDAATTASKSSLPPAQQQERLKEEQQRPADDPAAPPLPGAPTAPK